MKYLVVDDEIVHNNNDIEDFKESVGADDNYAIFVPDYCQALKTLKETTDIVICYVDLKIPHSTDKGYTETENDYWGLELIPEINKLKKNIDIAVYSSHIQKQFIRKRIKEIRNTKNVVGCYGKPDESIHRGALYKQAIKNYINNIPQSSGFDYSLLSKDLSIYLNDKTKELRGLIRKTLVSSYFIGKTLIDIKSKLNHGQFSTWLEFEFDWNERNAQRFMSVAKVFSIEEIRELSKHNVSIFVLSALSTKSTPPEIRTEIVSRLHQGININSHTISDTIKQVKNEYKAQKQEQDSTIDIKATQINPNQDIKATQINPDQDINIINPINTQSLEIITPQKKQEIVGVISPQRFGSVGKRKHIVVCQDPNSEKFLAYLPKDIDLCLFYPPNRTWEAPKIKSLSTSILYSDFPDPDQELLLQVIEKTIESITERNSNIVLGFIPDKNILLSIDKLECRAFIADPNRDKCLALLNSSKILEKNE